MITNEELMQIISDLQPWIYDTSVDAVMYQRQEFVNLLRHLGPDGFSFRSKNEIKQVLRGKLDMLKDSEDTTIKALKYMLGDIAAALDVELEEDEVPENVQNPLGF